MEELHRDGKISMKEFKEWTHGVEYHTLPEHVDEPKSSTENKSDKKTRKAPKEKSGHKPHKSWGPH